MATSHGGSGGSIVNVSSAASYLGSPNEFVDYAATKGALDTMTIGLALEVADQANPSERGASRLDRHRDPRGRRGPRSGRPTQDANVPMKRWWHSRRGSRRC